jgi:hypothetical protein
MAITSKSRIHAPYVTTRSPNINHLLIQLHASGSDFRSSQLGFLDVLKPKTLISPAFPLLAAHSENPSLLLPSDVVDLEVSDNKTHVRLPGSETILHCHTPSSTSE